MARQGRSRVIGVATGGGVSEANKPSITFDGKWSGWRCEIYEGKLYWEAMFTSSGTLTVSGNTYTCDAWGIGGGGRASSWYSSGTYEGNGGGSGFTNMASNLSLAVGAHAITIGAGGLTRTYVSKKDYCGEDGGATTFLALSCAGGGGAAGIAGGWGVGGSNGGAGGFGYNASTGTFSGSGAWQTVEAGANGTPGAGKIMSKFWSSAHNTEYGAQVLYASHVCGGGGGYMDFSCPSSQRGHGYGAGGAGTASNNLTSGETSGMSGCLLIRIKI